MERLAIRGFKSLTLIVHYSLKGYTLGASSLPFIAMLFVWQNRSMTLAILLPINCLVASVPLAWRPSIYLKWFFSPYLTQFGPIDQKRQSKLHAVSAFICMLVITKL